MRIKGQTIEPPKPLLFAIPREDHDIILFCKPVMGYKNFDELVPEPKPPMVQKVGKEPERDFDDRVYKQAMLNYSELRMAWIIINSLDSPDGLEWDLVDKANPETWSKYEEELRSCFTEQEAALIVQKVMEASAPTVERQKEALERFVKSQAAAE